MKISRTWLITAVFWLYFLVGLFLYVVLHVAWVNTFDLLFGFVVLLAASVWYITDRLRQSKAQTPRKSNWVIGPWGIYRRNAFKKYQSHNLPQHEKRN